MATERGLGAPLRGGASRLGSGQARGVERDPAGSVALEVRGLRIMHQGEPERY